MGNDASAGRTTALARLDEIRREFTRAIEAACPGCQTSIKPIQQTPDPRLPTSWRLSAGCTAMYLGASEAIELYFRVSPDHGGPDNNTYLFDFDLDRSDPIDIANDAPIALPPYDSDDFWPAFIAALESAAATVRDNMPEVIRLMDPSATFEQ